MTSEAFYKKSFQIQCDYPTSKIEKDKLMIFNSPEQWIGGFPWIVSLQYKFAGRKGAVPFLNVFIKAAKGDNTDWGCVASTQVRLQSQQPDVRDITWTIQKEYKHSVNSWGSQKFCEWSKLPSYVKDGKLNLDVCLVVLKETCKGGTLPPAAIEDLLKTKTTEIEELKEALQKATAKLEEKDREIHSLKTQLEKEKARLRNEKIRKRETEAANKVAQENLEN